LRSTLADTGLMPRQARLLDAISLLAPIQQRALAQRFSVSAPSMSVMLARLERDGLVVRDNGPGNSKDILVALTPRGAELIPAIQVAWHALDAAYCRPRRTASKATEPRWPYRSQLF
jgi:DNA-binding MarR family transcriptional regulator